MYEPTGQLPAAAHSGSGHACRKTRPISGQPMALRTLRGGKAEERDLRAQAQQHGMPNCTLPAGWDAEVRSKQNGTPTASAKLTLCPAGCGSGLGT